MTEDREQRIQERAYAIWEAEGRPEGREREHWQQAQHEVTASQASPAADSSPTASPVKKPRKQTTKASAAAPRSKKKPAELRP